MFSKFVPEINKSLIKTKRAIISLGCSFVEAQGAINDELYTDYKWEFVELGVPLQLNPTEEQKIEIMKRYPLVGKGPDGKLDFTFMELDNAFVNVLCKTYFKGTYTPINLGMRGKGNRATIKDLSMFPGINWDMAEEIIVIYCPSSPERFDFIADQYYDGGGRWECMWPHDQKDIRKNLWDGYRSLLWSEKFGVIEQIAHMQELKMWCKLHNAKLIITPAFDGRFTREYFNEQLGSTVVRDHTTRERTKTILSTNNCRSQELIDQWPWENMFHPAGQPTFVDAVIKKEFPDSTQLTHFFEYTGKGSPDLWITACAHPSAKGHDYFASLLYNHITGS